jgi:hypothetical protein
VYGVARVGYGNGGGGYGIVNGESGYGSGGLGYGTGKGGYSNGGGYGYGGSGRRGYQVGNNGYGNKAAGSYGKGSQYKKGASLRFTPTSLFPFAPMATLTPYFESDYDYTEPYPNYASGYSSNSKYPQAQYPVGHGKYAVGHGQYAAGQSQYAAGQGQYAAGQGQYAAPQVYAIANNYIDDSDYDNDGVDDYVPYVNYNTIEKDTSYK